MQMALALLGIGLALFSLSLQFSRAGIGWFFVAMALAIVSMYSAFAPRWRASPVAALIGFVLLLSGAVGLVMGMEGWVGGAMIGFGVAFLVSWSAIELPEGRHAHWKFQKRGTVH